MAADQEIVSREQARAAGLKKFFTGVPCRHGHVGPRWVSSNTCAICTDEKLKKLRDEDPNRFKELDARRYKANRQRNLEAAKAYREANQEVVRERVRAHYYANRTTYNAYAAKRRAAKNSATPPWVDPAAIVKIFKEAERLTLETGVAHEVDHVIPLQGCCVSGLHVPWNLAAVPAAVNRSKQNRWGCSICEGR